MRRGLTMFRLMRRSLTYSRGRTLSELVALTVSAAVATALLTIYGSLDAKLHREFRAFGANVVITGSSSPGVHPQPASLPADALSIAQQAAGRGALAVPFAYAVVQTRSGDPIVAAGTDIPAAIRLNPWWQVSGSFRAAQVRAGQPVAALVGVRAAQALGSPDFVLSYNGQQLRVITAATVRTGDAQDSRVYLPLAAFRAWTQVDPVAIEVQAGGDGAHIRRVIGRLQQMLPEADVRPVHQLVDAEAGVVSRTRSLMLSSLLLISLTVAVCVLATLSSAVFERRRDFAVMKALGATGSRVGALFLSETLALAAAGIVFGYAIGCCAAYLIGRWNFHTSIAPLLSVAPQAALLNLLIATIAAAVPLRSLRRAEPAALLRGE